LLQSKTTYSLNVHGLIFDVHTQDISTSEGIWTIGYGHACQDDSDNLPQYGVVCRKDECSGTLTKAQAEQVKLDDAKEFVKCVRDNVKVPITQNQFDAMVSLAFNIGCSAFKASELLKALNAGTITDKSAQFWFTNWHNKCNLAGIRKRRFTESQLFSSCATSFGCVSNSCDISNKYLQCQSNCKYCDCPDGCTGDDYSMC
jgi:GH24 family phage-related lysozyme (muramidase)